MLLPLSLGQAAACHCRRWQLLLPSNRLRGALSHAAAQTCRQPNLQVAALSQLRSLHLQSLSLGPHSFAPLLSLPGLERLDMFNAAIPSCLSCLTGLRTLTSVLTGLTC